MIETQTWEKSIFSLAFLPGAGDPQCGDSNVFKLVCSALNRTPQPLNTNSLSLEAKLEKSCSDLWPLATWIVPRCTIDGCVFSGFAWCLPKHRRRGPKNQNSEPFCKAQAGSGLVGSLKLVELLASRQVPRSSVGRIIFKFHDAGVHWTHLDAIDNFEDFDESGP